MAPPSALEQACVIKGGLGCVIGNSINGYHYNLIILDFLLEKVEYDIVDDVICIDCTKSAIRRSYMFVLGEFICRRQDILIATGSKWKLIRCPH